jgi:hypothetical protein
VSLLIAWFHDLVFRLAERHENACKTVRNLLHVGYSTPQRLTDSQLNIVGHVDEVSVNILEKFHNDKLKVRDQGEKSFYQECRPQFLVQYLINDK